jgi:hypothetical protein
MSTQMSHVLCTHAKQANWSAYGLACRVRTQLNVLVAKSLRVAIGSRKVLVAGSKDRFAEE